MLSKVAAKKRWDMLFKWPWFGKQLSYMWANLSKQHSHFKPGEIAILFIQPILIHSCFCFATNAPQPACLFHHLLYLRIPVECQKPLPSN